jgi:hypothetical protein
MEVLALPRTAAPIMTVVTRANTGFGDALSRLVKAFALRRRVPR